MSYTILRYSMLCYIILHYTMLHYTMLHYTILYNSRPDRQLTQIWYPMSSIFIFMIPDHLLDKSIDIEESIDNSNYHKFVRYFLI
ncbi:hypothetical protein BCR42DRAFT_54361 [Absidia repens]|uniref:Uncharacterized protein n=1 Tax=Absidia repens TaxID=90262 RepID=A0A1X2IDI5_9FUNG|nr:hypothetical protein BCR42DRAFT_54361 [Absidia repens]